MSEIYTIENHWNNNLKKKTVDLLEETLEKGITSDGKDKLRRQYIESYTLCYNMCHQRGNSLAVKLYNIHTETVQRYLRQRVLPSIQKAIQNSVDPTTLLEEIKFRWDNHVTMNKWYAKFFRPVDRNFLIKRTKPTLTEKSLDIFKTDVYAHISTSTKDAILSLIKKDRDGEIIDKALVKSIVMMYEAMGMGSLDVYESDLEAEILCSTREYYSQKREEMISQDSTPEYLMKIKRSLMNEEIRVNDYLNPSTKSKLLECIDKEMIEKTYEKLIQDPISGCASFLKNDRIEDLQLMFEIIYRIGDVGLNEMAKVFETHVKKEGTEELNKRQARIKGQGNGKDKPHDPEFVNNVIKLHQKYLDLVRNAFGNYPAFDLSIKNSFKDFLNQKVGEHKNLVILSTSCDNLLKKGDNNLEESLEEIIQLFLYLNEKDRFVDTYRNQFAKRLLSHNPPSADDERIMITKLKSHCGSDFTSKLEGMLNDFELGKDTKIEFSNNHNATESGLNFAVQVIHPNHWPAHEIPNVVIPQNIGEGYIDQFTAWYAKKHNHSRNLKWIHSVGSVTIKATYGKKSYSLEVIPLQAIVLNALNNGKSMFYKQLKETLNLEDEILKPVLHSLSCGTYKLLSKSSSNTKIGRSDKFIANSNFSNKKLKIRVPIASFVKTTNATHVEEGRKFAIEAAVVRIMKARKTLEKQALVSEVLRQLGFFKPNARDIKKIIGNLVEKEYLERTKDSKGYNYLA